MRIMIHTCPACGTVVAANELEDNRVMKCQGLGCQEALHFDDLPAEAREHFLENRDRYQI